MMLIWQTATEQVVAMMVHSPFHPGRSVLEDCMEPLGLSISEAGIRLGTSRQRLSILVRCKTRITPEVAIRLDKAFGGGAEMWYRVQSIYDLGQVKHNVASEATSKSMPGE